MHEQKAKLEHQVNEKHQDYEELLKKFELKERDYSMLSDSLYRMKKEKEIQEKEDKELIVQLQSKTKS